MSKRFILFILAVLLFVPFVYAENYDPYTLPGFNKYRKGQLGSRQKSQVDNLQKKYPDGYALPGYLSYVGGDLKKWQKLFYPEFIKLMGLTRKEVDSKRARDVSYWFKPFDFSGGKKNKLNKLLQSSKEPYIRKPYDETGTYDCKSEDSHGRPLYSDYYPPRYKQKKDHIVLYSCAKDDQGIRVYKLVYKGFEGHLISAYLFIPNHSKESYYKEAGNKAPSLIYYHGHGSTKEDAAFNPHSYVKGIAYHAALNGFIVLVPDVRGFGESIYDEGHKKMARRLRDQGTNYLAAAAVDALYAQDLLESIDYKELGFNKKIDKKFNVVGGVSLGGEVSLIAGALDDRFEVVSMHGIFIGYEVLFSKFHCDCSKMTRLSGQINVFDVAMLVAPRTLHIGMGAKDQFFNNYSKSAIEMLAYDLTEANLSICIGDNDESGLHFMRNANVRNKFQRGVNCPMVLEIDNNAKHEVVGYGFQFQRFWHDYLGHK